jgi:hypothetical protein
MATLRLPDRLVASLIALAVASDDAAEELDRHLTSGQPALPSEDFPSRVAASLKLWEPDVAEGVIGSLASLCSFQSQNYKPDFVDDILGAIKRRPQVKGKKKNDEQSKLPIDREATLRERLTRLLSAKPFSTSAKAAGVLTDNQRSFVGVRVLSDIRPVFQEDPSLAPAAAVIIHSLKIEFTEDDERRELFVALDSKDLGLLADAIARARQKDESLRQIIAASKLAFLEPS